MPSWSSPSVSSASTSDRVRSSSTIPRAVWRSSSRSSCPARRRGGRAVARCATCLGAGDAARRHQPDREPGPLLERRDGLPPDGDRRRPRPVPEPGRRPGLSSSRALEAADAGPTATSPTEPLMTDCDRRPRPPPRLRAGRPLQPRRALLPGGGRGVPRRVRPARRHHRGRRPRARSRGRGHAGIARAASRPRPARACTCASSRSRSAASSSRDGACGRIASGSAHPAGSRASVCSRGSSTRASPPRSCCAAPCPGGTAAAAQIKYEAVRASDPRYVYHGRVVRRNGWICLHYLYFYFMNDYRSTFYGVNDHEADWEQVFIYLEDAPDGPRPVWIAAAAHDYTGDELRRRWDDPTLEKVGRPPGHQRRCRVPCLVLRARRVPDRGAHPRPPRHRQLPRRAARVLARHAPTARPG